MRMPFLDPRRDEVVATAIDLITRFGLRAHDEASYLAELSAQMHSRRRRVLYELVAREIDASFAEAQKRLGLRQSASDTALPGVLLREGHEGGSDGTRGLGGGKELPPKLGRPAPHVPSVFDGFVSHSQAL
jgi:hypothetical protein